MAHKHVDPVDPDSDSGHCLELGHEDPRIVDQAVYAGHQLLNLPTRIGTEPNLHFLNDRYSTIAHTVGIPLCGSR
jgi:hypothetical protein